MKVDINKIKIAKSIYETLSRWKLVNKILTNFFNENKLNNSKEIVLIKIVLVDSFYKTNLKDQISIAEHIFSLPYLDEDIAKRDINVVERIAKCGKNYVSFASKFCHFHNKPTFPIYDQYVCRALKKLIGWKISKNYSEFFRVINQFRNDNALSNVSYEDIDKFLWMYGLVDRLKNNKEDINREILAAYKKNEHLFNSLYY